jgi:putative glutamine amidotransferase
MKKRQKPIIGITLCYDKDNMIRPGIEYGYIRKEYSREVAKAGGEPIFLDENIDPKSAAQLCDGIIISGGQDIEPIFYGQQLTHAGPTEPSERTAWDLKLIKACDNLNLRILGVCYGAQLLNVHYGGTLYQDLKIETGTVLDHGSSAGAAMHDVIFERDFLDFSIGERVETASRHHQAVNDIAPDLHVVARAADGTIEAIAGHGHFGIQWHAESDGTAPRIYSSFVALCSGSKTISTLRRVVR